MFNRGNSFRTGSDFSPEQETNEVSRLSYLALIEQEATYGGEGIFEVFSADIKLIMGRDRENMGEAGLDPW